MTLLYLQLMHVVKTHCALRLCTLYLV